MNLKNKIRNRKQHGRKSRIFRAGIFLVAACLSGCAGKDTGREESNEEEAVSGISGESSFDWHTQTFFVNEQIEEHAALGVEDFYLWEHEEEEDPDSFPQIFHGTDGTNFYTLKYVPDMENGGNLSLSVYNAAGGEQEGFTLPAEALTEEPDLLYITAASILSSEGFSIQANILGLNEKGRVYPKEYRTIRLDYQGNILWDVDLLSVYESRGLVSEGTLNPVADCIVDGESRIYSRNCGSILITDSSGSLLMAKDYGDDTMIGDPVLSEDGMLIFPVWDEEEKTVRLVCFDAPEEKEYSLAELEYSSFQKLYALRDGHVYYGTLDGIVDWDIRSGNRYMIFRYKDNAIMNTDNAMLAFDGEGRPVLRVIYEKEDMVLTLGENPEGQEEVRIADFTRARNGLLKSENAAFSRRNPLYGFSCEMAEEGQDEAFRDRIMAELVSGKGPDILYLSREDLLLFQEKGVLADLEELISPDTIQALLPGAVELGRVEGKLVGLPGEMHARTVCTRPEIWDGGAWSVSDILNLAEERGDTVEAILPTDGESLLYYLVLLDLEHSEFIDWEKNSCSFAGESFVSILETIRTYSLDEAPEYGKDQEMLLEGKCLGVVGYVTGFIFYEGLHEDFGEDMVAAGFPSETGKGNYLIADGILAINAASTHKEAAAAYLEYVLSVQGQSFCSMLSVRRNMLTEDMVLYGREDNKPYLKEGENTRMPLATKKDGSVYIGQYNEFLESCVPYPDAHTDIANIISEEAAAFFSGDKTAEQTAEVIDSRVQLYLDEHR